MKPIHVGLPFATLGVYTTLTFPLTRPQVDSRTEQLRTTLCLFDSHTQTRATCEQICQEVDNTRPANPTFVCVNANLVYCAYTDHSVYGCHKDHVFIKNKYGVH